MKISFAKIVFLLFYFSPLTNYSNWDTSFLGLLEKFEEEKLTNYPIISLWYGYSINDNALLMLNEKFALTYNLAIEYGFLRIKQDKTTKPYYLHYGERVYFENQSSHLKPKSWAIDGKTIDGWVFGLKAIDGLGAQFNDFGIEFQHYASLIWNKFDFENYYRNVILNQQIQKIDEKYKFGRNFGNAIAIKFGNKLQIGLNSSQNFIYQEFEFQKWIPAYLTEVVLQKWMDIFDEKIRSLTNSNYWVYKYIYKIIISTIITNMMKEKPYLFFKSDKAFHNASILVKISYIGF